MPAQEKRPASGGSGAPAGGARAGTGTSVAPLAPVRRGRFGLPVLTLSTRVAVTAGFFVLVSVAALSFILIRAQREQVLAEVVHGSESIAEAILLSVDRDMRVNQRDGVRELVAAVGKHAGISSIRIYNKRGRISYSSKPEEEGKTVDVKAEACVQCHGSDAAPARALNPEHRSRIYTNAQGEKLLGTIYSIENRKGCQGSGCHVSPDDQRLLGVLDVQLSLDPAEKRLAAATRGAIWIALLAAAVISMMLFFIVRRSVQQPINRMIGATKRVAGGGPAALAGAADASVTLPRGTAPEIEILADSFSDMMESLSSSKQRVEDWASSLEAKVADKARELRAIQFQVVQAEKLASVGVVAAGIAHELNSPLMAIITFTHLVRGKVSPDSREFEDLRMIEREANRCAVIIRQLLDFSRQQQQEPEKKPMRARASLDKALDLLKVEVQNAEVKVNVELPEDLPKVLVNEGQLMQVFVNLIINAVHAMPHGGELEIQGDEVRRRDLPRLDLPAEADHLVRISVRDTGTGIARADLSKVFDPFFTTKPPGKGSGLGLSVSMGIVQGFGGTIMVDSDGESWTEFTVLLPAIEEPAVLVKV